MGNILFSGLFQRKFFAQLLQLWKQQLDTVLPSAVLRCNIVVDILFGFLSSYGNHLDTEIYNTMDSIIMEEIYVLLKNENHCIQKWRYVSPTYLPRYHAWLQQFSAQLVVGQVNVSKEYWESMKPALRGIKTIPNFSIQSLQKKLDRSQASEVPSSNFNNLDVFFHPVYWPDIQKQMGSLSLRTLRLITVKRVHYVLRK